jgi:hypothetical protein
MVGRETVDDIPAQVCVINVGFPEFYLVGSLLQLRLPQPDAKHAGWRWLTVRPGEQRGPDSWTVVTAGRPASGG